MLLYSHNFDTTDMYIYFNKIVFYLYYTNNEKTQLHPQKRLNSKKYKI